MQIARPLSSAITSKPYLIMNICLGIRVVLVEINGLTIFHCQPDFIILLVHIIQR